MSAMCSRVCRNEGNVMKSKREKYYTDKNRSICLLPSSTLEECSTDRSNSILLNIKQTGTNITFWTSHRLEWVHQVVIKHPIFGFKYNPLLDILNYSNLVQFIHSFFGIVRVWYVFQCSQLKRVHFFVVLT